ncbi:hypothetical protein RA280_11695 [Cupriavidus sp. CV2]|nr:hypothetical protein [Cupriavidus sp. CV2]
MTYSIQSRRDLVGVGHHDSVQPRYVPVANRFAGYSLVVLRKNVNPKGAAFQPAVLSDFNYSGKPWKWLLPHIQ